jgi:predicted RNase H-like nuclease
MIGIDGCKKGYMIAQISNQKISFRFEENLESIKDYQGLILIDVPCGCPSNKEEIRPEPLIRQLVKGRASSVFNVPALQTLNTKDYQEANKINREILGKGLSKQSFHIIPIIKDINNFILSNPYLNIHESFPELIFTKFLGHPCKYSKHKEEGKQERINCLKEIFPWISQDLEDTFNSLPKSTHLDVIDAAALACCATLIDQVKYSTIPRDFQKNSQGIDMKVMIFNS